MSLVAVALMCVFRAQDVHGQTGGLFPVSLLELT